jgi:AraC family transcriptional regulator, dual regulator of chb operon
MELEQIPIIISDNNSIDPDTDFHYELIQGLPVYRSYHRHDFFEIVLVIKGRMYHLIKEERHLLHEGMLLFIRPEDYHYFEKADDAYCSFINLAFSAKIFRTLLYYLGENIAAEYFLDPPMPPVMLLSNEHTEFLTDRIDKLNTYFSKMEIKAEFRAIMADILSCFLHEQLLDVMKDYPPWLQTFYSNMHKREYFSRDITHLYRTVYKSREHVSRVFKKTIGRTPTEYMNDIRMNYAARSLIHSDNPVLTIALDAGFENLSHFYHLFKKKYNISPCRYRNMYQKILITRQPSRTLSWEMTGESVGKLP